jgi:cytochrome c553
MRKLVLLLLVLSFPAGAAEPTTPLAYPNGYREWTHVKTVHLKPGHPLYHTFPGIHHVYANKKALEGYKRGKFSNGSTFVLDLLDVRDEGFVVSEGGRKLVAVMHKNSARFPETGGWGYEAFIADSRKDRIARAGIADCFRCHEAQKNKDFVFSAFRK